MPALAQPLPSTQFNVVGSIGAGWLIGLGATPRMNAVWDVCAVP